MNYLLGLFGCSNYDAIPEIPRENPPYKIDRIFRLFEQFALNPLEELFSRNLYYGSNVLPTKKIYVIGEKSCLVSICGMTYRGIMKALFNETKLNTTGVHSLSDVIQRNAEALHKKSASDFFAYGFELNDTQLNCGRIFGGHGFVVIQYLDDHQNERYRFYQSYIMSYSLQEYLRKGKNDFSREEFQIFLDQLKNFIKSKKWSQDMEDFHQHYFEAKTTFPIDSSMQHPVPLSVKWGVCNVKKVLDLTDQFSKVRKSPEFPHFILCKDTPEEEILINKVYQSRSTDRQAPLCKFVTPSISVDRTVQASALQTLLDYQQNKP